MNIDHILTVAITTLTGGVVTFLWRKFIKTQEKQKAETEALKAGLQSLLRYKIIDTFETYSKKGWIPIYALEGINACYIAYENLGENGVIDTIMDHLKQLPNHPPEAIHEVH